MLSGLSAWLASEGVGLLLGALGKILYAVWQEKRADQALRELGAARAANKANRETIELQDDLQTIPRPSDDAVIDRLRSGTF